MVVGTIESRHTILVRLMSALHSAGCAGRWSLRVPPGRAAKQETQHNQHLVAARHADCAAPVNEDVGCAADGGGCRDGANGSDSVRDCLE